MKDGETRIEKYVTAEQKIVNGWKISSLFGDRAFFDGDWLKRAAGDRTDEVIGKSEK